MRFRITKTAAIGLAIALICAGAVIWAVSSNDDQSPGDPGAGNPVSRATDYEQALAGAPPALAKLYANGDALIAGGAGELQARLGAVRGYPAVVNVWASWCGPCRAEFPHLQAVAAERGDEVAFIGVDTDDSEDAANDFLDQLPLPYPSVSDPESEVQEELGAVGLPSTAFYDADGELVHVKQGPYRSEDELNADIDRYAS